MMRFVGVIVPLVSALFFPWPLTAFLTLGMTFFEPLVPLVTGIFVDTLYYVPHDSFLPLFTLLGGLVTVFAFFVRSRLLTSSIQR